ncbi:MAG: hypothetical protein AAF270_06265 [Pseudomonadota bacterium]
MNNMIKPLIAVASLSLAGGALAECEYPSRIDVPNGSQASKEEMMDGQKSIKAYMEKMNTYLDCIDAETASAKQEGEAAEVTAERQSLLAKKHNAAIEEMEAVAADFNEQVRAYKAKSE